jgi:hypothetical protein
MKDRIVDFETLACDRDGDHVSLEVRYIDHMDGNCTLVLRGRAADAPETQEIQAYLLDAFPDAELDAIYEMARGLLRHAYPEK